MFETCDIYEKLIKLEKLVEDQQKVINSLEDIKCRFDLIEF